MDYIVKRTEKQKGKKLPITDGAYQYLYQLADGDGRYLLNMCEELFAFSRDAHKRHF